MKDENYYIAKGYKWATCWTRSNSDRQPIFRRFFARVEKIIPKSAATHFRKGVALHNKLEGPFPAIGANINDLLEREAARIAPDLAVRALAPSPWVGLLSTPPEELTGKQGITSVEHTRSGTSYAISDKTTTILPFGSATKSGPNANRVSYTGPYRPL